MSIAIVKAFEELHPYEIVRLYYGKLKKADNQKNAIGVVAPPPHNPVTIPRNTDAKIFIQGCFMVKVKKEKQKA